MNTDMIISETFDKIVGLYCWDVYYNKHLNLCMSFGQPVMRIREPESVDSPNEGFRIRRAHRLITVRGEWWLWVLSAYWKLSVKDFGEVTRVSSISKMKRGLSLLDGQILTNVQVNPKTAATEMEFDLGAKLSIRRRSVQHEGDMWSLYQPNSHVLSVRADGKNQDEPGDTASDELEWKPIAE